MPVLRALGANRVLLADHHRPLLPPAPIAKLVDALASGAELVVPVLPVTDTVKVVDGQREVSHRLSIVRCSGRCSTHTG